MLDGLCVSLLADQLVDRNTRRQLAAEQECSGGKHIHKRRSHYPHSKPSSPNGTQQRKKIQLVIHPTSALGQTSLVVRGGANKGVATRAFPSAP
jgi:hypothetical protein